jgi:Mn-dependent DtxR family transcriptional regulator
MEDIMGLHESGEMYLETIFVLSKEKGAVRAMDVATHMNYSKPSVSRAVHLLEDNGYIDVSKEGLITLTDSGLSVAHKIYERHTILTSILIKLGVSESTALEDACKLEHAISDESFEAIKKYMANQGMLQDL